MVELSTLKEACRENDTSAEQHGVAVAALRLGVNIGDLTYIADQRALRLVLINDGIPMPDKATPIRLTPEQRLRHTRYMAAYVDGIALGLKAASLEAMK